MNALPILGFCLAVLGILGIKDIIHYIPYLRYLLPCNVIRSLSGLLRKTRELLTRAERNGAVQDQGALRDRFDG